MTIKKKLEIYATAFGRISSIVTEACHDDCSSESAFETIIEVINETEQKLADDDT